MKSFAGARYFVTFIDQSSRFSRARPLKRKSEVLSKFDKFRKKFYRQNYLLKISLHSDNGGEYVAMEGYLEENGIIASRCAPYTPQKGNCRKVQSECR